MSLSDKDKGRIFEKLDELKDSSTRTEVRLEGLQSDMSEFKDSLKEHETLGSSQYHGLLNKVNRVQERVSILESKPIPKFKPWNLKGIIAALTALVLAVTGAWAALK